MNSDTKSWLLSQMEPRATFSKIFGYINIDRASRVSTAISLKRIADLLELQHLSERGKNPVSFSIHDSGGTFRSFTVSEGTVTETVKGTGKPTVHHVQV